jgi:hypothetical protein
MKKLSEQFLEMSQRTAAQENRIAAIQRENQEEFAKHVAEARTRVQTAQSAFAARLDSLEASVSEDWHALNDRFSEQIAAAQKRADERKNAMDLAYARRKAEAAEAYADVAAEFARLTAAEAEKAMIEAKQARANAESLAQTVR